MMLFIVLGIVVLVAVAVTGFLFYLLSKQAEHEKAQPLPPIGVSEFKKQEDKEGEYQKKVAQLEHELNSIAQKAQDQSREALGTIEELKKENEQLRLERKSLDTGAQANLIRAEQTIETMREEQTGLQTRLDESQVQVGKLQEEMLSFRHQVQEEMTRAKSETDRLMVENESLRHSIENTTAEIGKKFADQINALKEENQALKHSIQDLNTANQKLEGLNAQLAEKAQGLQWELTKARAQQTSFERACENYQNQLKALQENTQTTGEDNSELKTVNNQLQAMLEDFKKQNEEFGKREKLMESELEKYRNQIITLERDYENLRANKG